MISSSRLRGFTGVRAIIIQSLCYVKNVTWGRSNTGSSLYQGQEIQVPIYKHEG